MRSRAFAASLAGRLCYGIVSLSLILELTAGGRDYGLAGLAMALFGLAVVLVFPFRAWLVDRHGPRLASPPMTASFAVVLVAIAVIPARAGVNDAAITAVRAIATAAPGCAEFYCAGLSGTELAAARARLIPEFAYPVTMIIRLCLADDHDHVRFAPNAAHAAKQR